MIKLLSTLGIAVEVPALCKYMSKMKFTRQKMSVRARV